MVSMLVSGGNQRLPIISEIIPANMDANMPIDMNNDLNKLIVRW